jgi:primosomal protein N'
MGTILEMCSLSGKVNEGTEWGACPECNGHIATILKVGCCICRHEWWLRGEMPERCPNCGSEHWNADGEATGRARREVYENYLAKKKVQVAARSE